MRRPLSVVIPSKTASNFNVCAQAVRECEPDARIVLVDDGIDPSAMTFTPQLNPFTLICGAKPFCFSKNVNLGILATRILYAGEFSDNIVVLNDDAILKTDGGFTLLQQAAEEHPEYGIISATTNVAGNPEQYPRGVGLRTSATTVAFVCVLIPRRTIDRVGLLDERFGGNTPDGRRIYGWDDNDYCRRVREAGLMIGIHDGCFVDHGSLQSTFRGHPHAAGNIEAGAEIYRAKWGDLN